MYINCKTWFSFLYGTFSTEELVAAAEDAGAKSLVLSNINNTCDAWDFVDFCRQKNINPVLGCEIRNGDVFKYILIARNNKGFREINGFLSQYLKRKEDFPDRYPFSENVYTVYALLEVKVQDLAAHEFIGVQPAEVNLLYNLYDKSFRKKYLVRQPVTFQDKKMYNVHRLLSAIRKNIILSKQEKKSIAQPEETFVCQASLIAAFSQYPDLITNTLKLLDDCSIEINFSTDKTKKLYSVSKEADRVLLQKLAFDGLKMRYGPKNKIAKERVIKELKVIDELGFNAYFLITWDIIRYAKSRSFFYVGRGSGANSIVAYCLEITDVDPIDLDLYFERFLNPHRSTPPDFDIDFSWKDRDDVIDYIFKRYGSDHVCLLGSYVTFQNKAIIRELGKVFGLPKEEIDQLEISKLKDDKIQKQLFYYGNLIKNFPHHLSIHAGGILISDKPIYEYTATELPPKNFPTAHIDMFVAEKIGLFKLDILSQRGLGHIKEAMEIIRENKQVSVDIHNISKLKNDANISANIRNANTIGCFYIESPGMRQLLQKLHCDNYITLVAASSIIRPGVAQSGMMKQYIYRFHHPNDFQYLHPKMKELLEETYGVMVYQEDVIKVAHHFAGLDMAEADILRRAMSGKYRGHKQFDRIKEKFFRLCNEKEYDENITNEVWRQIESFGGYSFSKAHSASFAVESYQSLFLKTYFPMEFMVAVINNFGGFYSRELYFHELKKTGAHLHAPCINNGEYLTSIMDTNVYVGFIHVQGLEENFVLHFLEERKRNGNYLHLLDFIDRLNPTNEQLNILIRIGAFRFTLKTKKELLWEANFFNKKIPCACHTISLFSSEPVNFILPALSYSPYDDAMDEIELLGFPLSNIFELADLPKENLVQANEIENYSGKEVKILGYLITSKPVRTIKQEVMYFHTFIDSEGNWLDTVFFPEAAKMFPVNGKGFYLMKGKVVEEFDVYSVEVNYAKKIGIKK